MTHESIPSALARMTHAWQPYVSQKDRADARGNVERIKINRAGYDGNGSYWGAGPDVFTLERKGAASIAVRARAMREAREKIAREIAGERSGRWITVPGKPLCIVRSLPLPSGYLWQVGKQCGYAETLDRAKEIAETAREIFPRKLR